MIFQALRSLADDLLRRALCMAWKRNSNRCVIWFYNKSFRSIDCRLLEPPVSSSHLLTYSMFFHQGSGVWCGLVSGRKHFQFRCRCLIWPSMFILQKSQSLPNSSRLLYNIFHSTLFMVCVMLSWWQQLQDHDSGVFTNNMGTLPYFHTEVCAYLGAAFPDKWIGCVLSIPCPLHSPDLMRFRF